MNNLKETAKSIYHMTKFFPTTENIPIKAEYYSEEEEAYYSFELSAPNSELSLIRCIVNFSYLSFFCDPFDDETVEIYPDVDEILTNIRT